MDIISLLSKDRVACDQAIGSKKRAFQLLAHLLTQGQIELTADEVFDRLIRREKLGSTTLGNGSAIPHAQLPISRPRGAFLSLNKGINIPAPDRKPVKLFFALLVPEESRRENLAILSKLTFLFSRSKIAHQLARYKNPDIIMNYFDASVTRRRAA